MSRLPYIIGAVVILGFGCLGVREMTAARAPYLTRVSEVRKSDGGPVQFIGKIVPDTVYYFDSASKLIFVLADDRGVMLKVNYKGVKPANFDTSEKALVRGKYTGGEFIADQILLKCPSKYR
ncbi:cytochrome c maturation protein CcmE [bacterium]|nr:cytochrome c maturation protein CcmE [bacterium]